MKSPPEMSTRKANGFHRSRFYEQSSILLHRTQLRRSGECLTRRAEMVWLALEALMDAVRPAHAIPVTSLELQARFDELLQRLIEGVSSEVEITSEERVVALLTLPQISAALEWFNAFSDKMRGTVVLAEDFDPGAPVSDEPWDAELGSV